MGLIKLILLFCLTACYLFAALGLLSFGIVSVPCLLLGRRGVLTVTSDLAPDALLLICTGSLLMGIGMSLGAVPICRFAYGVYTRTARAAAIRRERAFDEEDGTA